MRIGVRHIEQPRSNDATVSAQLPQNRECPHCNRATPSRSCSRQTSHELQVSAVAATLSTPSAGEGVAWSVSASSATSLSAGSGSSELCIQDWERRVSTRGEHCQQLVVNSRHDLKRGVEVDFVGDLLHVKLLCRSKQQCCSTFPSVGNSTVELVAVQLGVTAASECFRRPWCHTPNNCVFHVCACLLTANYKCLPQS